MIVWMSLALFVLLIYMLMGKLDTPSKRRQYLIIVGVAVALVMSLRGDHGGKVYDYRVYVNSFELIAMVPWSEIFLVTEFEQGFVVLCKLLSYISKDGQTLIIFQSLFCIYAVCRFIYKNTEHVFETFFFFITLGTMGFMLTGIRQAIAVCTILFSVEFIKSKRLIPFLLLVLLAFTIHRSSIIFIMSYFLVNNERLQKNRNLIILISVAMIVFADKLIDFGSNAIYEGEWSSSSATFSLSGVVNIIIYFLSAGYQLIRQKENTDKIKRTCFSMSLLGAIIYFMRYFSQIMERAALYFVLAILIGLSDFYDEVKKGENGILFCFLIIVMCLVLYWKRMSSADYGNYVLFWLS